MGNVALSSEEKLSNIELEYLREIYILYTLFSCQLLKQTRYR